MRWGVLVKTRAPVPFLGTNCVRGNHRWVMAQFQPEKAGVGIGSGRTGKVGVGIWPVRTGKVGVVSSRPGKVGVGI